MNIKKELLNNRDLKLKDFTANLNPTVDPKTIIGVRMPICKNIAKAAFKEGKYDKFLSDLPHKYFDEYCVHGYLISEIKDYDVIINYLNKFLPYINNWQVCDILKPKPFIKNKDKLIKDIKRWLKSKDTFTVRFAVSMLMTYYLDDDFDPSHLDLVGKVKSKEYYINMMRAWYFATALAKQRDITVKYIEAKKLDDFTHNKAIQKAIESNRILDKDKKYLKTLKV